MLDAHGGNIEWRFIEQLHNLQDKEGLRAGKKLKESHIMYHKIKTKVALAAQTWLKANLHVSSS
jgi:hypothetical protein